MADTNLFTQKKYIINSGSRSTIHKFCDLESGEIIDLIGDVYMSQLDSVRDECWKRHRNQINRLIVLSGIVEFQFLDQDEISTTICCSEESTVLEIMPLVWYRFSAVSETATLLNIPSKKFNEEELERTIGTQATDSGSP